MKQLSGSDAARLAAEILRSPGTVALLPTETVYGLMTRAGDDAGAERIYLLKNRDPNKRLQLLASSAKMVENAGGYFDERARRLVEMYCPGPLMLIIQTRTPGTTLGFRIPSHPLVLSVIETLGEPLHATSANRSGMPDCRSVKEALENLCGEPDCFFDGGMLPEDACGSTIVDLTTPEARLLRQGAIPFEEILAVLKKI